MVFELDALAYFTKIEVVCPTRPSGNIVLDFKQEDASGKMRTSREFVIKQGEPYHMRVYFQVYYNIVFQLKYKNIVKKFGFQTKQE